MASPAWKDVLDARVIRPSHDASAGGSSLSQTMTSERPTVPPVLYLPCRPGASEGDAEIEMRQLDDGRVALLAYTALDRLAHCCGPHQPWVLYRTEELSALRQASPYDNVVMDQELPRDLWHTGEAR